MSLVLERERIVQAPCSHYAQDHLTTGELERRFEEALVTVLEGLPAMPRSAMLAPSEPTPMPTYRAPTPVSGLRDPENRYAAFFAEVKKEGAWRAPSFARVRGGATLGTISVATKLPKKDRLEEWRRQLRGWLG